MQHNYSKNFYNKKELLVVIESQDQLINRLFFAARNLSVSKALYLIEDHFAQLGFDVKADWNESSFGNPSIDITLFEKKKEHLRYCRLKRSTEGEWNPERTSSVMYSLEKVEWGSYSPYKLSAHVINFQQELASPAFFSMVNELVHACNYPFNNTAMSYADKIPALIAVEDARGNDYMKELFAMSRETAIYNTLRNIKGYFKDNGFKVALVEPDLSQDESDITVQFVQPNFKFTFDISISRLKFDDFPADISPFMYKFGRIHNTAQTPTKSKVLTNYLAFIFAPDFESHMEKFVNGLNYPFNYDSASSF